MQGRECGVGAFYNCKWKAGVLLAELRECRVHGESVGVFVSSKERADQADTRQYRQVL